LPRHAGRLGAKPRGPCVSPARGRRGLPEPTRHFSCRHRKLDLLRIDEVIGRAAPVGRAEWGDQPAFFQPAIDQRTAADSPLPSLREPHPASGRRRGGRWRPAWPGSSPWRRTSPAIPSSRVVHDQADLTERFGGVSARRLIQEGGAQTGKACSSSRSPPPFRPGTAAIADRQIDLLAPEIDHTLRRDSCRLISGCCASRLLSFGMSQNVAQRFRAG
jgi:hypothetical protein